VLWDGIIIALGVQFAGARERSGLDLPEIGAEQSWVGDNLPFVNLQKAGTGLAGDELRIGGSSASEEAGARGGKQSTIVIVADQCKGTSSAPQTTEWK
jgi:hypothetical protein